MTIQVCNILAKAIADLCNTHFNEGTGAATIKIYSGSVPTDADTALGAQVLLATLTCTDPASGAATDAAPGGRLTFSAITSDSSADATGTASFFRILDSDAEVKLQGSVAASGADLNFNTVAFVAGAQIDITSFTLTMPE